MLKNSIVLLKNSQCFHTTCEYYGKSGKVLLKIMGTNKKKFYATEDNSMLPPISTVFGKSSVENKMTGNPRRNNVLNKLFMRHVTDIMATGEYSKELLGYGIEVNKVKVSPDFKFLNVYWIAEDYGKHEAIEILLTKNAGHLRHELSTLRVMGEVPKIVFVKDKTYCKLTEIQERLRKADFGEDYEPPDFADQFKSELEIITALDKNVKAKLKKFDLEASSDNIVDDPSEIPPMPQNVFGLNHADILTRVKKKMSISKASHRSADASEWARWSEFKETQPVNQDPVTFGTHQEQRKAFKEFLQQRQIMKMKQHRLDKNWTPDKEYLDEERKERYEKSLENESDIEEEDYIVEEILENESLEIRGDKIP